MRTSRNTGSIALISLGLAACGSSASAPPARTAPSAATFSDQVERGGALYGQHCAECHGASGEGGRGPRVVGLADGALPLLPRDGAQRTETFTTVADVAGFVVRAMPADEPASLPADDYWAILAFDLHANGIDLAEPLTPELAATLTIPR